ncbi:hypothetical protein AN619_30280 [Thermotalea metallivorans]|uniref:Uncharacterized protein n=1 Tax=Thermotalea metallivorans TaxID=520762 RepID=A0A140KZD5_9FIRM|nr:hypothetical protein AN619_30280 [Thermotalea metallivorans]
MFKNWNMEKMIFIFKILSLIPILVWILYNLQHNYFYLYSFVIIYLSIIEFFSYQIYLNIKRLKNRNEAVDKKMLIKFSILEAHSFAMLAGSIFLFENNRFSLEAKILATFVSVIVITILTYLILSSLIFNKSSNIKN